MFQKCHFLSLFHKQLIYYAQPLLPCFKIEGILLSLASPYECFLSPLENPRLQRCFPSIASFLCKYVEFLICIYLYLLKSFTTIILFVFLVPSFLCNFPVRCALSIKMSSLIPNFSFTKSVIILSLSSHVSLVSS